jgi:hypothetical protein
MDESLQWRRVAVWLVGIAATAGFAVALALAWFAYDAWRVRETLDPPARMATDAEQVDLLRVLHADGAFDSREPEDPRPILLDGTLALCGGEDAQAGCTAPWIAERLGDPALAYGVPPDLRRALVAGNARSARMPDPRLADVRFESMRVLAITGLWQDGLSVVHASRAAITGDGALATMVTLHYCGPGCGVARLHAFARDGRGGWRLLERQILTPFDPRFPPPR